MTEAAPWLDFFFNTLLVTLRSAVEHPEQFASELELRHFVSEVVYKIRRVLSGSIVKSGSSTKLIKYPSHPWGSHWGQRCELFLPPRHVWMAAFGNPDVGPRGSFALAAGAFPPALFQSGWHIFQNMCVCVGCLS